MGSDERHILALETSGQTGSVAIGAGAGVVAAERLAVDLRHAAELMPAVQRLLQQQGWPADSITDVFVSIGPGSFTGLRIAVSVARTLAWAIGARVVAVPTMHALARNALETGSHGLCGTGILPVLDRQDAGPTVLPVHVAMIVDAKRSQVYT
ncbi:MAG: tRNA (adenosine(37)-N6)-threonylcarbamoyltransferase complex dimerization subunit type 1 TsaB, partial [Planctomycetes bacterium]|nr:tRNA (adenosine(37)-N6)-threonylcarbamoyltransferase complex dimerization subunit type 1 TsaB [Planctomycetota bacterium]